MSYFIIQEQNERMEKAMKNYFIKDETLKS